MDFKTKPTFSTPELTSTIAEVVYDKIKEFGDVDLAFKGQTDSAIDPEHFKLVNKEADRIISELNSYKNGKLLKPEEFHYTEEGEKIIDKEAVYYVYTTDEDLALNVTSDLLDVSKILGDF